MSSFDELSFGSSLTRSVLAAAVPDMDPTAITVRMSTNMRRIDSPLSVSSPAGSALYPAVDTAVTRCLVPDDACPKGKREDSEADRAIDMPEPSSREMACSGSTIWAGREAVPELGPRVQAVHRADDSSWAVSDPDASVGLG